MNSERLLTAIFDAVQAKKIIKTGFVSVPGGIYPSECDTVAAHSNAVAILAVKLAFEFKEKIKENFDADLSIEDIALMGLFHDYGESKSLDTGAQSKGIYPTEHCKLHSLERDGLKTVLTGLKGETKILRLFDNYRKYDSLESIIVHIADNLEGAEKALHSAKGTQYILAMIKRIIEENLSLYKRKEEQIGPVVGFLVSKILLVGLRSLFNFYQVPFTINEDFPLSLKTIDDQIISS